MRIPPVGAATLAADVSFDLASREREKWEWAEAPQVLATRPELWRSRTTVFVGTALRVDPQPEKVLDPERQGRIDLDGSKAAEGWRTMVKFSLLPEYLAGHETNMQRHILNLPGTPVPIGDLQLDLPLYKPPSNQPEFDSRRLYAHAYQNTLGSLIPDSMSESGLSYLFEQLTEQLRGFSKAGAHYRDLNLENVLCKIEDGQVPQLVLVDHGNMRLDGNPRGSSNLRSAKTLWTFPKIAEEDTRSANPKYLPSSMGHAELALRNLTRLARERARSLAMASDATAANRSKQAVEVRRELLLYAYSHIDDLESSCYKDLPSSTYHAERALRNIIGYAKHHPDFLAADNAVTGAPILERVSRWRRRLLLFTHSHIDDLESSCYVHMCLGVLRSLPQDSQQNRQLRANVRTMLEQAHTKRELWETRPHGTRCRRITAPA